MQLMDKSLLIADEQDRYRMLETLREYARERLSEAGETESVRACHLEWCLTLAERSTPEEYNTTALADLGREYDNLRAALRSAIDTADSDRALRLAGGLWDFWSVRGFYTEGRAWLSEILELPSVTRQTTARARALQTAGHLANCQGDYPTALELLEESRAIAQEFRDDPALGVARLGALRPDPQGRARRARSIAGRELACGLPFSSLSVRWQRARVCRGSFMIP